MRAACCSRHCLFFQLSNGPLFRSAKTRTESSPASRLSSFHQPAAPKLAETEVANLIKICSLASQRKRENGHRMGDGKPAISVRDFSNIVERRFKLGASLFKLSFILPAQGRRISRRPIIVRLLNKRASTGSLHTGRIARLPTKLLVSCKQCDC